jgi:hypothetical protein
MYGTARVGELKGDTLEAVAIVGLTIGFVDGAPEHHLLGFTARLVAGQAIAAGMHQRRLLLAQRPGLPAETHGVRGILIVGAGAGEQYEQQRE